VRLYARALFALVLALLSLGAIGDRPATGQEPGAWTGDVPDGMWYDPSTGTLRSDALEMDAALFASSLGMDEASALALLIAQRDIDRQIDVLQKRFSDAFVGLYWEDGLRAVAQFNGNVPSEAVSLLEDAGVTITPQLVKYSAEDLEGLHEELRSSLAAMGSDDFVVATDTKNQQLTVTIGTSSAGGQTSSEAVLAQLPQHLVDLGVEIDVVNGQVANPWSTYGGAEVKLNSTFYCTTGFTVRLGTTDGVATAGHCGTSLNKYFDPFYGVTHNMTYQNGHVGTWGDFEWFTTTGIEYDDFYHKNSGALYDVSGVKSSFSVGDPLAWYGRGTKNEYFGTVGFASVTIGSRGNMVCMTNSQGGPGDSGGPVYTGNTAAGLIYGEATILGVKRMCFSQAKYIDDAISVSIKQ